jgi:formylglycine-generating enzyme required for sulfatase activity
MTAAAHLVFPAFLCLASASLCPGAEPPEVQASEISVERSALEELCSAIREHPYRNSLGMDFVPVEIAGGPTDSMMGRITVFFATTHTTVAQYRRFVEETGRDWPKPGFAQRDDHPAVKVNWYDAIAFCEWLTEREHVLGGLPSCAKYRLPSDHEWSCAVGIGKTPRLAMKDLTFETEPEKPATFLKPVSNDLQWLRRTPKAARHEWLKEPPKSQVGPFEREDANASPEAKSLQMPGFPWGAQWPPPKESGNYADEALRWTHHGWASTGRFDGFAYTSPVRSFQPNAAGLYDMGGNAWQWCMDLYNPSNPAYRVARGASWYYAGEFYLRSSYRNFLVPSFRFDDIGFRCVIEAKVGG